MLRFADKILEVKRLYEGQGSSMSKLLSMIIDVQCFIRGSPDGHNDKQVQ
jgi:hypothetical protein